VKEGEQPLKRVAKRPSLKKKNEDTQAAPEKEVKSCHVIYVKRKRRYLRRK